ncbi:hypothetical protein [Mycobacterium hubeiense]|uniref:hypothetical protein n=1 Tax=Mycobacterium hubeiense TaxID=1867256 RepID=UPI000C7EEDC2|nr:hypothetical protein [Mycobacterium sp. QGD 101]
MTMPETGPLDHIVRSGLPWRAERLTECGRSANDVASTITLDELKARIEQHGKRRTAFTVCITCWTTAAHAAQWEVNPIGVIGREAQRCGCNFVVDRSHKPEAQRFTAELHAIAALIEAHRDEFDGYITGLAETASLTERRRSKRRGSR